MKCSSFCILRVNVIYGVYTVLMITSLSMAMFTRTSREQLGMRISQPIRDVAVADVDGDGNMDLILVSSSGPNVVLNYDFTRQMYTDISLTDPSLTAIRDEHGITIGVCACDVDGDGREDIYLQNSIKRNFKHKFYKDKLFQWQNQFNRFDDLFNDDINSELSTRYDGHSVSCLDRIGNGRYGVLISDIRGSTGSLALVEVKEGQEDANNNTSRVVLEDVTLKANLGNTKDSQSVVVGPILGEDGTSDIFMAGLRDDVGRHSNNQLLNSVSGVFYDIALDTGITGKQENGRAAALADVDYDGIVDIISVNMMGKHRLYLQRVNGTNIQFENKASEHFEQLSSARSVIAADFDNDGILDILLINAFYRPTFDTGVSVRAENTLYQVVKTADGVLLTNVSLGDVRESSPYTTGASVADMDGDGLLELYITSDDPHAESLSIFRVTEGKGNNWLRVIPLTRGGAPARAASVKLLLKDGRLLVRVVDPSSNLEPIAHIGLGTSHPVEMTIWWTDGHSIRKSLSSYDINVTLKVAYYGHVTYVFRKKPSLTTSQTITTYAASDMNKDTASFLVLFVLVLTAQSLP